MITPINTPVSTPVPSTDIEEVVPTSVTKAELLANYGIQLDGVVQNEGYQMLYSDMRTSPQLCLRTNTDPQGQCNAIESNRTSETPQAMLSLVNDQPAILSFDASSSAYNRTNTGWTIQQAYALGNESQAQRTTTVSITDSAVFNLDTVTIFGEVFCKIANCGTVTKGADGTKFTSDARMAIYTTQAEQPKAKPDLRLKVMLQCTPNVDCIGSRVDDYPVPEHPLTCHAGSCKINLTTGLVTLEEDSSELGYVTVLPFSAGNLQGYEFDQNEHFDAQYLVRLRGIAKQTDPETNTVTGYLLANWYEFNRSNPMVNGAVIMFNQAALEQMQNVLASGQ